MKKFLIISGILLGFAITASVVVFWYVSLQLKSSPAPVKTENAIESTVDDQVSTSAAAVIPDKKVSVSDSQREVLESVGIDADNFVITQAMQECAAKKLESDRVAEIAAGAAPTAMETMKLLPCLGAE